MASTKDLVVKMSKAGASPTLLNEIAYWVDKYAPQFNVNTPKRKSAFMANAAHETNGFKTLTEYASGAAYEGRKDLGNVNKGDGVKFKGRGIFQNTGRGNYKAMNDRIKRFCGVDLDLLNHPERLAMPQWAVLTAFFYWQDKNLNAIADYPDNWRSKPVKISGKQLTLSPFEYISYRINGGQNGIDERKKFYQMALSFVGDVVEKVEDVAKDNPIKTVIVLLVFVSIIYFISK